MNISILYMDSMLIICEKPVGISSESPGLPELVAEQTGQKVWPVHRLDQGTGGAVIFALSADACVSLQRMFLQSKIRKEYLAVISGILPEKSGSWRDLLWHDRIKNKSFIVQRVRSGVKEALCDWEELERTDMDGCSLSLIRVFLHTGRTHQIRVQFGSRGFPLIGDRKYGSRILSESVALWSAAISLPHPDQISGTISVRSVPPSLFPWNQFNTIDL